VTSFETTLKDFLADVDFNAPASVFGKLGLSVDDKLVRKFQTKSNIYLVTFELIGLKGDIMLQSRPDNPEEYRFSFFADNSEKQYTSLKNLSHAFAFEKRIDSKKGGVSYVYSYQSLEVTICADSQTDDPFVMSAVFIHKV
jgi:hypothetical protein